MEGQNITDSGDGKELDKGIQSLWKVYEEQLTEEEKEKEWGWSPYEIIMALDIKKIEELAGILTSQEITSILAVQSQSAMTLPPIQTSGLNATHFQGMIEDPDSILVNSPIPLTIQEAWKTPINGNLPVSIAGLDKFIYHKPKTINDAATTTRRLPNIPDLFPFMMHAAACLPKPEVCLSIAHPEPVSVYSAWIASSFLTSE